MPRLDAQGNESPEQKGLELPKAGPQCQLPTQHLELQARAFSPQLESSRKTAQDGSAQEGFMQAAGREGRSRQGTSPSVGILTWRSQRGQDLNKTAVARLTSRKGHDSHPLCPGKMTLRPSQSLENISTVTAWKLRATVSRTGTLKPVEDPHFSPPLPALCSPCTLLPWHLSQLPLFLDAGRHASLSSPPAHPHRTAGGAGPRTALLPSHPFPSRQRA